MMMWALHKAWPSTKKRILFNDVMLLLEELEWGGKDFGFRFLNF